MNHDRPAAPASARSGPRRHRTALVGLLTGALVISGCGAPEIPSPQGAVQTAAAVSTQVVTGAGQIAGTASAVGTQAAGAATQVTGLATQVAGTAVAAATAVAPLQSTAQAAATQIAPTAQAAATQVIGTAQAVATQGAPGAQSASTQVVGTAQAVATQVAPAANAAATQMAPALQAVATQIAGPAGAAITSQLASGPVQISGVSASATDPTVTVRNSSSAPVPIGGGALMVGSYLAAVPGTVRVPAGGSVTLHLGAGTSTATDIYLGGAATEVSGKLTPGARVILFTAQGVPTSVFTVP